MERDSCDQGCCQSEPVTGNRVALHSFNTPTVAGKKMNGQPGQVVTLLTAANEQTRFLINLISFFSHQSKMEGPENRGSFEVFGGLHKFLSPLVEHNISQTVVM